MIPEDILKSKYRVNNLNELTIKLYSYVNDNPGKGIAFWGYTYQTAKLINEFENLLGKNFLPVCIIDNFKYHENYFLDRVPIVSFDKAISEQSHFDLIVIMVDSPSIFSILEQISSSSLFDKNLLMVHRDTNPVTEVEFRSICNDAQSVLSKEGVVWYTTEQNWYCCYQYLKQVSSLNGDIAEFGVFQGGSAYFIASVMKHFGMDHKKLFLFDSFSGLTDKKSIDFFEQGSFFSGRNPSQVERLLSKFNRIQLYDGNICDTLPSSGVEKISLAHIDCDQYLPTKVLCENLYDKLVSGGIMMFQNYSLGITYGERIAVDIFFKNKPENILFGYDGAAFIIKI